MSTRTGISHRRQRDGWALQISVSLPWPLLLVLSPYIISYLILKAEVQLMIWVIREIISDSRRAAAWLAQRREGGDPGGS